MNHYYTDNTALESNETTIEFSFNDHTLFFRSDNGVFSKERVDYGSRVLLNAIELTHETTLLDVGCGYGTIGISLKDKYPQLTVDMIDVNDRAIHLANTSVELNHQSNIKAFKSDGYENVLSTYDCIVTNPPIRAGKKVVSGILAHSIEHLNINGCIYVVIQKKQGAPSAKKLLEETFGNCEIIKRDKGYYILKSIKA